MRVKSRGLATTCSHALMHVIGSSLQTLENVASSLVTATERLLLSPGRRVVVQLALPATSECFRVQEQREHEAPGR
jgi:hypothetical protein